MSNSADWIIAVRKANKSTTQVAESTEKLSQATRDAKTSAKALGNALWRAFPRMTEPN